MLRFGRNAASALAVRFAIDVLAAAAPVTAEI